MFALPRVFAASLLVAAVAALAALPAVRPTGRRTTCRQRPPDPAEGNDDPRRGPRRDSRRGSTELQALIKDIGKHELLPDVQIYEKAVRWALDYNEIYDAKDTKSPGGERQEGARRGPRTRESN